MNLKYKKLLDDNRKLIEYEAGKYSHLVPHNVVLAEAYKIANHAAETFNENAGAKFSTHLTNQLKKLSRIANKYGASVRLPENQQYKLHRINQAEAELAEKLDRPASVHEISEYTHIPIGQVNRIKQNKTSEVTLSALPYAPVFMHNVNDDWVHFVYHDLTDHDKVIFEHKTGFGGKQVLTNEEIAKKLKLNPSTVNNRTKLITERIMSNWSDET
jgi:DNA-directed RNA polymerase sigma subunit (sigma70/sigma32)